MDMVPRLQKLEGEHSLLNQELKQVNKTLSKIELTMEKQNEISSDIRLLRQEFKSHREVELESIKLQNERIEDIERNLSKIAWIVFTAIIAVLVDFVVKGNLR
ncbi:MAG: hypothetical protein JHC33_14230 [Ignisphaera sp.]|nr:hypothetical protein [Ignisphaera sp.]